MRDDPGRLSAVNPVDLVTCGDVDKADIAVIFALATPDGPRPVPTGVPAVDRVAEDPALAEALCEIGFAADEDSACRLPSAFAGELPVESIVVAGLGERLPEGSPTAGTETVSYLRLAAAAAARSLGAAHRVAWCLPYLPLDLEVAARALIDGALLAAPTSANRGRPTVAHMLVSARTPRPYAIRTTLVAAEAAILARELVDAPPNILDGAALAEVAAGCGVTTDVLAGDELEPFGGLRAVGAGSARPPLLIRLRHRPQPDGPAGSPRRVALVGKGVTFDAGGLAIKPLKSMTHMKADMAGAAVVLAVVQAAARLELPVEVDGWLPVAENLPSGTAVRPGDVIRTFNGTTVEVRDPDAEGRLMLADVIARAAVDRPDVIIDVATLTAAQTTALGRRTGAVMGNDARVRTALSTAGLRVGELFWSMPLPPYLAHDLRSTTADLNNAGRGEAPMLTAGVFLQRFVPPGMPWAHLDIAGPAYNPHGPYGWIPHGATGFGVRTLIEFLAAFTRPDGR